jgi:two-component system, chemotaxis family, sensor kinase CheA
MNELLEQFLVECRDLIDAATMDLLALETAPEDRERLDGAFRGFHTLKGAAGIVDFAAMGRLLHAAEEVLVSVRAGSRTVSGELISDCLACLDQVARWLDETASAGEIPALPANAAEGLVSRFTAPDRPGNAPANSPGAALGGSARIGTALTPPAVNAANVPDWIAPFLARNQASRHQARAALRYTPAADCFLRGEDPLALIAQIPELLALELTPRRAWPPLDELDPFMCDLVITALSATSPNEVLAVMRNGLDDRRGNDFQASEFQVWPIAAAVIALEAKAVLEEQVRLAASETSEGFAGRLTSAGLVAANVLRRSGRSSAASAVSAAVQRSLSEGNGAAFIAALRGVPELTEAVPEGPSDAAAADTPEASPEPSPDAPPPDLAEDAAPSVQAPRALRVDAQRIDALVSLAGELTVVKNAVGHTARRARDGADAETLARVLKDQHALLDRLVSELQRSVLGLRVLPLRHVFQNFPRVVREMARELGKPVQLIIEGETTEADKATVEALFEPLLHVLRNAMDHGIEAADERRAAGKPQGATVHLRASRDGDRVIVEVADDGRGIDAVAIRRSAVRRGMASETALAEMPDQAVIELIFSPGFSTAAAVTGLSGRGVGMDAVRAAVARLGGRVTVKSQLGTGTSVVFTLPYTVLMLRVMTVQAGGQMFGVPIDAVVETTKMPRDRIARVGAAEAIVQRDRTVPLVRLADLLDLPRTTSPSAGDASPRAEGDANIVVASIGRQAGAEQLCALEVESCGERMDVMLRPMEGLLAGVSGFAGTTLVGDGGVLIVLDLEELLR